MEARSPEQTPGDRMTDTKRGARRRPAQLLRVSLTVNGEGQVGQKSVEYKNLSIV